MGFLSFFFVSCYGDDRELPVLAHSFPTRRSSDLTPTDLEVQRRERQRMKGGHADGVIFEFITVGSYVNVSAIDAATGTAVSIAGAPASGQAMLRRTALRKLAIVLAKQRSQEPTSELQSLLRITYAVVI